MTRRGVKHSILAITLLMTLNGGAQEIPTLRESVAVTLIEVPVTVVDRHGEPVRNLGSSDFEIYDAGKRVPVQYFETIDLQSPAVSHAVNPAARLHVILLFDLSNSTPGHVERSREAAIQFVEQDLRQSDLVAVATYSVEQGLRPVTTFTSDRQLLSLAIETLGHPKFFRVADPLFLSATSLVPEGATSGRASGFDVGADLLSGAEDLDRMNRRTNDEYLRRRLQAQLESFGHFARLLDGVRGRKQVVLLSEGFEPRLVHGRESTAEQGREELDAIASGQPWRVDLDQRYGFTSAKTDLSRMAKLFRRSDVIMHAIDIKGLRTDVDARSGYGRRSNESLFLLTNPTGGQVFKNANDLSHSFRQIMKQQEVVYLLGFPAQLTGRQGQFHELDVGVKGVPGAKLTHRSGYYEPAVEMGPLEKTLTVADILINDIQQRGIPLATLAVPFRVEEGDWKVPVIVEIPGPELIAGVEGDQLDAELFIYAFDRDDSVHDFQHQKIALDLSKLREALQQIGIKFYGVLRMPPGEYAIKALVRVDQSDRRGFQRQDIRIGGDDEPLLLPPLLLEDEGKWLMLKAEPRSADERSYPFHLATESFVPAAAATLDQGVAQRVALFAYNLDYQSGIRAGLRSATGASQDADLSVVAHSPGSGAEPNKLLVELDTTRLSPGRYHLDLALGEGESRRTVSLPLTIISNNSADDSIETDAPLEIAPEGNQ